MDLTRFKRFPPGRAGVLLPSDSRRTAALGICMYTASRPAVLRIQRSAFALTRLFGAGVLPGAARPWAPNLDEWDHLVRTWRAEIGPFDGWAVYERRRLSRTGLTILLVNDGKPVAVTKIRDEGGSLEREQRALDLVQRAGVHTFSAPKALGVGALDDGLSWSAQTAVFDAPHRPVFAAPTALFEEIRDAVAPMVGTTAGQAAAHNDLTPWNLRVDRHGRTWLFDWEDVGPAPQGADRCYFSVTSHALHRTRVPGDLTTASVDHWSRLVADRPVDSIADKNLRDAILAALDIARHETQEQQVVLGMTP